MPPIVAYIAEGKLFLKRPDQQPELVESAFVQSIMDRAARDQERNAWKGRGNVSGLPQGMLWQFQGFAPTDPSLRRVQFRGLARAGNPGELLYSLETDRASGLFLYDSQKREERRLVHRSHFGAVDLCRHPGGAEIACSVQGEDGTAHIGIMNAEGGQLREVTEGDALDQAPSWVAGEGRVLLFQSAGIGRNEQGLFYALGPYSIMRLDLDKDQFGPLLEDAHTDFLLPRMTADGSLCFIRRPYEPWKPVPPWRIALDVLLFPIRLLVAIFAFLNFFSMVFAQKPLTTAGGPKREELKDSRTMMLWGRMIEAERSMRKRKADDKALVPANWELVRRRSDGQEEVLARHVLSYDLADDGSLVYTDGRSVFHQAPGGAAARLCAADMVERVIVAG